MRLCHSEIASLHTAFTRSPGPLHQREALEQRGGLVYEVGASAEKQLQSQKQLLGTAV